MPSLKLKVAAELELRRRRQLTLVAPTAWDDWLRTLFPSYVQHGFSPRHQEFWQWLWALKPGVRPCPFVAIWPRGGAKSTSAELACVAIGARQTRRYILYVCETQEQADDHVGNIAAMLEASSVERYHPELAARMVGKYGNSRGWRRNRIRTASALTVDAIGLDSAARGAKIDEDRPGLMVLDDLDSELDSGATTEKKITSLTKKLLPAGAADLAVLAVQNLVHPDSIFSRMVDGRADFLSDRIVSGPHPALEHLAYEQQDGRFVLTHGEPTWEGQDLARCQAMVDDMGLSAFLSECQHEVEAPAGGMFDHLIYRHCRWDEVPELVRTVVWVDPAVTSTDNSDSMGIQADGLAEDETIYRLYSWEDVTSPEDCMKRALRKAVELGADSVGVETDQGGDTWISVFMRAVEALAGELPAVQALGFRGARAGSGHGPKAHRAAQMLVDYEQGRIIHVLGTHEKLERALRRFPRTKPFDLVDAGYWSWFDLRGAVRIR